MSEGGEEARPSSRRKKIYLSSNFFFFLFCSVGALSKLDNAHPRWERDLFTQAACSNLLDIPSQHACSVMSDSLQPRGL